MADRIALTVIGGYLGAGKTSLVNHLLRNANGRRIGVIVNDFGSLAIDVELLVGAQRDGDVIGLTNGCVCCSIGAGLHEALEQLVHRPERLDHVIIEASGVADPAVTAAWATVPPFEPAGVVVLADASAVQRLAHDRYVGDEVCRQLRGADLLLVTKTDLCSDAQTVSVASWLAGAAPGVPQVEVVNGVIDPTVVLGVSSGNLLGSTDQQAGPDEHMRRYDSWAWSSRGSVDLVWLREVVTGYPDTVLRVKGVVRLADGTAVVVHRVGRRVEIRPSDRVPEVSELVAIAVGTDPPTAPPSPFA